jgi:Putative antitoxin of bacterial toxin-antitoxin system, YdaS/YdaT
MAATSYDALDRVIERISRPKLAKALKISRIAVWKWRHVPIERVPRVAEITGLPRHEIRPDRPDLFPPPG